MVEQDQKDIDKVLELSAEVAKLSVTNEPDTENNPVFTQEYAENNPVFTQENGHGNESVNVQIDQSEAPSVEVEDDQQLFVSSSATSLGLEFDDKSTEQETTATTQYAPSGNDIYTTAQAGNVQHPAHDSVSLVPVAETQPTPRVSTLPSLTEYLGHVGASKDYADWILQVHLPSSKDQPFQTYAHTIILLRSPRMRRLMTRPQSNYQGYQANVIELYPPRAVLPHAFESALRFFYSDTIISKDFFLQQPAGADALASRMYALDYILSYWVSGVELGLDTIVDRAETLFSDYLDWDLIETAYKAGDDIAKSEISSNSKYLTGTDYFALSKSVIRLVLHFLVSRLDVENFNLDITSTSNVLNQHLPQVDETRPRTNPALASMVFGSMPSSAGASPDSPQSSYLETAFTPKDTIASNVLLNLSFEHLHRFSGFLQRRGADVAERIMTEVVNEREARRQKVLNSQSVPNSGRMAHTGKWDVVGHQESFADGVLTQKRVGFLLPSSR